jgi:AraC-like DNA-binding protein
MPEVVRKPPYPPLFEATLGLRLFYCLRSPKRAGWSYGPAALSPGKVGFSFAAQGSFWAVVNGERILFRRGDLLALRPGDVSSFSQAGRQRLTMLGLGIECDHGGMANALLHRDFPRRTALRHPREFVARFARLEAALQERRALRDWSVAEALAGLVAFLLRETAAAPRPRGAHSAAERAHAARAWAMENLARPFPVAEWARAAGASPAFLDRAFRQEFGQSPRRWLENQRLETARQQLLSTARSVKEVAFAVGYEDPFYFSRVFHKRFGQAPREYRRAGATF